MSAPTLFDVEPEPEPASPTIQFVDRFGRTVADPYAAPVEPEHQDDEPERAGRRYRCDRCAGIVALPRGAGPITTERLRANHDAACPSPRPRSTTKTGEPTP